MCNEPLIGSFFIILRIVREKKYHQKGVIRFAANQQYLSLYYAHNRRLLCDGASMYFAILIHGDLALASLFGGLGLSLESIATLFGIVP